MQQIIRFGIPSADGLIGGGLKLSPGETTATCVRGSNGTGKSVFALHLAATYASDTTGNCRVIFVSTDLSYQRANEVWDNFRLGSCNRKESPFETASLNRSEVALVPMDRDDDFFVDQFILGENPKPGSTVGFLDLRTGSSGDEWGYLCRLLGLLPSQKSDNVPKHMFIIDAVEGLEVFVGETDTYGEKKDRRSRISQLLRSAGNRSHVVFVVEDSPEEERVAELFVSDLAVRLRTTIDRGYSRREIEIEKIRGQYHVRGTHELTIRSGKGSSTGEQENPDDSKIEYIDPNDGKKKHQSYVLALKSLHFKSRFLMEQRGGSIQIRNPKLTHFGIRYLDEMLEKRNAKTQEGAKRGFPAGEPIALIGEDGTYKSGLSKAFLAGALNHPDGVAVLLTTKALDRDSLSIKLDEHFEKPLTDAQKQRILCRRIEIHYLSADTFLHIVEQLIAHAQKLVFGIKELEEFEKLDEVKRRAQSWKIRFVIDGWSSIRKSNPEIDQSGKLLPYLLFLLRREGVASMLLATEEQGFTAGFKLERTQELRDLTARHIYTWRVPLFGESRVAITITPPLGENHRNLTIRELSRIRENQPGNENQKFAVNPMFELYQGLESLKPEYVPLRVLLYSDTNTNSLNKDSKPDEVFIPSLYDNREYSKNIEYLFREITNQIDGDGPIKFLDPSKYENLRDVCEIQGVARVDRTDVLQVDEFWAKSGVVPLKLQRRYLLEKVAIGKDGKWVRTEDPLNLFQPTDEDRDQLEKLGYWRRCDNFKTVGYSIDDHINNQNNTVVKIPYLWDFGFLMCINEPQRYLKNNIPANNKKKIEKAEKIWKQLSSNPSDVSWRQFLEACKTFSSNTEKGINLRPFGMNIPLRETIACIALEIWASEINNSKQFSSSRSENPREGLEKLTTQFQTQLFLTLLLLKEVMGPECFEVGSDQLNKSEVQKPCIASREWYSTALAKFHKDYKEHGYNYYPTGNPGQYSVRGDWFLSITRGSRSYQIGERAIDLLCSRRGNIMRLQEGIGLPIRGSKEPNAPDAAELWTPLQSKDNGPRLSYSELINLGAKEGSYGRDNFNWLWRSRISNYARHARTWGKWLCRSIRDLGQIKDYDGFAAYDRFHANSKLDQDKRTLDEFSKRIMTLSESLTRNLVNDPQLRKNP